MSANTQTRIFGLNDAIERDRAARVAEAAMLEAAVNEAEVETESRPWELWLAIAVGVSVIVGAALL